MTDLRIDGGWVVRLTAAAVVGLMGFVAAAFVDFEPHPLPFAVMVLLVFSLAWLVIDCTRTPPAQWTSSLAAPRDRVDEANADHRILTTHQQANEPSGAVRARLLALARGRDPALAATLETELSSVRRLRPTEIDHILTRIEQSREPI